MESHPAYCLHCVALGCLLHALDQTFGRPCPNLWSSGFYHNTHASEVENHASLSRSNQLPLPLHSSSPSTTRRNRSNALCFAHHHSQTSLSTTTHVPNMSKRTPAEQIATSTQLDGWINPATPTCPECNASERVVEDVVNGQWVCTGCGLVVGRPLLSDDREWRTFQDDGHGAGVGGHPDADRVGTTSSSLEQALLAEFGLQTLIEPGAHLARTHARGSKTQRHRSLETAFHTLDALGGTMQLPTPVLDRAKALYKRVDESKECKTKRTDAVVAACLFIACRQEHVARTLRETSAVADVREHDLARAYNHIRALKLYKEAVPAKPSNAPAVARGGVGDRRDPLLARFANVLTLSFGVTRDATSMAERAAALELGEGRKPATVCGALLYMACLLFLEPRTWTQIAQACGMSVGSIRQCYENDLWPRRMDLVDTRVTPADVVAERLPARTPRKERHMRNRKGPLRTKR